MNSSVTGQLRDIQGIDTISWWPLAPGWWLLLAAVILSLTIIGLVLRQWINYPPGSWRHDARRSLLRLRRNARSMPDKRVAGELSEILRRIAITWRGRASVAGLTGEEWLDWLSRHDPNGFDWTRQARLLITLPYAPPVDQDHLHELERLIDTALRLLAGCRAGAGPADV